MATQACNRRYLCAGRPADWGLAGQCRSKRQVQVEWETLSPEGWRGLSGKRVYFSWREPGFVSQCSPAVQSCLTPVPWNSTQPLPATAPSVTRGPHKLTDNTHTHSTHIHKYFSGQLAEKQLKKAVLAPGLHRRPRRFAWTHRVGCELGWIVCCKLMAASILLCILSGLPLPPACRASPDSSPQQSSETRAHTREPHLAQLLQA